MAGPGPAYVFQGDEVQRILDLIANPKKTDSRLTLARMRNHAIVMTMYRAGLRVSEVCRLEMIDLNLGQDVPTIRVRKGKRGKDRTIGVSDDLKISLERWLKHRKKLPGTHVFCTYCHTGFGNSPDHQIGKPLQPQKIREMLSSYKERTGIPRIHPHAFRATLAVELVKEGNSLPVVRDVLGHGSIAMTDFYLRRTFPEESVDVLVARGQPKPEPEVVIEPERISIPDMPAPSPVYVTKTVVKEERVVEVEVVEKERVRTIEVPFVVPPPMLVCKKRGCNFSTTPGDFAGVARHMKTVHEKPYRTKRAAQVRAKRKRKSRHALIEKEVAVKLVDNYKLTDDGEIVLVEDAA